MLIFYSYLPMSDKNSTSVFETQESRELPKFVNQSCK